MYFAAHELAEQRRYMDADKPGRKPLYTTEECSRLIGGKGSGQAMRELRGDIRRLARLGLVHINPHSIEFAQHADEIKIEDIAGFRAMLDAMPNNRRSVPVPRRLLRAMAAGFSKGVTALITAVLIRGLYWHRETRDYRTDGRYKLSWVSKHFGISRRAATDARNTLIELGWLEPLDVSQWAMNRWGLHDRIVPDWSHTGLHLDDDREQGEHTLRTAGEGTDQNAAGSASPNNSFGGGSASPDQTGSLPLPGNQTNRTLRHTRKPSGVSTGSTRMRKRGRGAAPRPPSSPPNIRDIQPRDLSDTERLLKLHDQACGLGLASSSEAGRLEFLSLAQRARSRGRKPGAMFAWLLREQKYGFITQSDEDQASRMLREHLTGPQQRAVHRERWAGNTAAGRRGRAQPEPAEFTDEERFVLACIRVAKQHRICDPFEIVQAEGWTREKWDQAFNAFQNNQYERIRTSNPILSQKCEI